MTDTSKQARQSDVRRRTSIYLTDAEARSLKHIAADERKKVHDLFMEGILHVLSQRPDIDAVAETNRRLMAKVEAIDVDRAALTSKVQEIQADLELSLRDKGKWKKGVDPAASKLFWDGVLARAADVLRKRGAMTAEAILAGLPESTKKAAADGGSPMTPSSLERTMSQRAGARKMFEKIGKEFRLRED